MSELIWSAAAVADLQAIRDCFRPIAPDAAQHMMDRIVRSATWLLDTPSAGPAIGYGRWRKWPVKATPFLLIYRPVRDGLEIGRVRHTSSNWLTDP